MEHPGKGGRLGSDGGPGMREGKRVDLRTF